MAKKAWFITDPDEEACTPCGWAEETLKDLGVEYEKVTLPEAIDRGLVEPKRVEKEVEAEVPIVVVEEEEEEKRTIYFCHGGKRGEFQLCDKEGNFLSEEEIRQIGGEE